MPNSNRKTEVITFRMPLEDLAIIDRRIEKWNRSRILITRSDYLRKLLHYELTRRHDWDGGKG